MQKADLMVLCAGAGTRLLPLTNWVAKPLTPLGDKPVLGWILEHAQGSGMGQVVINVHHLRSGFDSFLWPGSRLHLSVEPELLGGAGGVARALEHLADPCVVWNGDIVAEPPLTDLLAAGAASGLCLAVADASGPGTVGLGAGGEVVRLRGERFGHEVARADYSGILSLGGAARHELPGTGCLIGDVCLPWLRRGNKIPTISLPAGFRDVGTPLSLLEANVAWAEAQPSGSSVAPGAEVASSVVLRGSVVGRGARLGGSGEVFESVIFPGAQAAAPLSRSWVLPDGSTFLCPPAGRK